MGGTILFFTCTGLTHCLIFYKKKRKNCFRVEVKKAEIPSSQGNVKCMQFYFFVLNFHYSTIKHPYVQPALMSLRGFAICHAD